MEALAGRVSGLAGPVVGTGTGIAGGVIFTTAAVLLIERTFYDRIERALEEDYWNFKQPIVHRGTFIGGAAAVISSLFLQNVPSNFTPIQGAFIAASVAGVRAIVSRASFLKQPAPYIENNIDIGVAMAGGLITAGPLGLIIGGLVAAGYIVAERVSDHLSAE